MKKTYGVGGQQISGKGILVESDGVEVNHFIVDQMSKVPEVNYIYSRQHGDVFYVWVVIKDSDDDAVDRVIESQQKVMHEFNNVAFDFSVIFQMGKDVNDLIAPATPIYQRA